MHIIKAQTLDRPNLVGLNQDYPPGAQIVQDSRGSFETISSQRHSVSTHQDRRKTWSWETWAELGRQIFLLSDKNADYWDPFLEIPTKFQSTKNKQVRQAIISKHSF